MSKLSLSVRIAAASLFALSILHVLFWAILAISAQSMHRDYPDTLLFPVASIFSAAGLGGVVTAVGLFKVRAWARIAALVLAALVAVFCVFGVSALLLILAGNTVALLGIASETESKGYLLGLGVLYFCVLCLALWWIYVFSRSSVAAQFSGSSAPIVTSVPKKPVCPPPIALLAWLMIVTGALSAISWPLLLGKIPAMLFNHVFSSQPSQLVWALNTILFLACGVGLLRLQRWSYTGTIALHIFWLVSLFVTQISPQYSRYLGLCLAILGADESATYFINFHLSPLISAIATAVPTALLIAGLFYYRRGFLQAVNDSRHLPS